MARLLELDAGKVVYGGEALAEISGKVCFIEGALPGEKVLAEITVEKKNFSRARVVRVLSPSPDRVEPPCPYVGACGGCQYQHVSYAGELQIKHDQLVEALHGIVPAPLIQPVRHSEDSYRYRNSLMLHTMPGKGKGVPFGFVGRDNKSLVAVKDCLLADESFAEVFAGKVRPSKENKTVFTRNAGGKIISGTESLFFRVEIGGQALLTSAGGFFQNNLRVTELLADQAAAWVDSRSPEMFADLYAGVGTFSFLSASKTPRILAVEENKASVDAMGMNREERKRQQMEIVQGRVETVFPPLWESKRFAGRAMFFLDPPRQGLTPRFAQWLSGLEIDSLVYVSCDAPALARDLRVILSAKKFKINEVVPFDMFPRTRHLETAAFLSGV